MPKYLDPKSLGLHTRTVIEELAPDTLAIVVNRKSRIIMADGIKILAKAGKIRDVKPGSKVVLKTAAPVCSKTLKYLADNEIEILNG
ncbi:MAG: hypothetical protein R3297_04180 [Desulfobulbales bacterium]|nr:hypothetical protein [Desulfobulbales bacterium]